MPSATVRRLVALTAALSALAASGGATGVAHAATRKSTSTNWAGYAVSRAGVKYRRVSATWVQPTGTCTPGSQSFAAMWVGLGGYHSTSKALEQIGTEADCSARGKISYSAWWELVPDAAKTIHLAVRPGDRMRASVTVDAGRVTLRLANTTAGTSFETTRTPSTVDLTSAEWIVEAPSACFDAALTQCAVLPLTNFGSATFANAKATSAGGYVGGIADAAHWSAVAISLTGTGGPGGRFGPEQVSGDVPAEAVPGDLTPSGTSFTVTYNADAASNVNSDTPVPSVPPFFDRGAHRE